MSRLSSACTAALLCCLATAPAAAQDALPQGAAPPANLTFVEGGVQLIRESAAASATAGTMLVDGDLVRTANGRAEIVFADGTLLHLDHDTELEILSPLRLRLRTGRVLLRVSAAATAPYVIDTHAAALQLEARGEYGVIADGRLARMELTVARGVAQVTDGSTRTLVRGGEMATVLGAGGRVRLESFNTARWDAFATWSNDRTNGFAAAASSRQLPTELRAYGPALDNYGRWDYMAPYGNVWFPAVGVEWRPYYSGSWALTRYGYTWIGNDPWSWPTHHYGRWGFTGAAWYWIPNRAWGPAWVSWSFVPGYVGWSPLGYDGHAVLGYPGRIGDHPAYRPNYDPWRAWTIVPRDTFGSRRPVQRHAIEPSRLPDETRRSLSARRPTTIESRPDVAVPRGGAPIPPGETPGFVRREPQRAPAPAATAPLYQPPPARQVPTYQRPAAPPAAPAQDPAYTPTYAVPRYQTPEQRERTRDTATPPPAPAAREDRPSNGARPAPQEPPAREDSPSGGRVRSPGVASPRAPGESSPPAAAPRANGEQRNGSQGGARRRPPQ